MPMSRHAQSFSARARPPPPDSSSSIPKGSDTQVSSVDLTTVTEAQLDAIAAELNERLRQTLGWMTPSEKFSEFVAMAA